MKIVAAAVHCVGIHGHHSGTVVESYVGPPRADSHSLASNYLTRYRDCEAPKRDEHGHSQLHAAWKSRGEEGAALYVA